MRRARKSSTPGCGQIVDAISIRERPAEVADRAVPGRCRLNPPSNMYSIVNRSWIAVIVVTFNGQQVLLYGGTSSLIAGPAAIALRDAGETVGQRHQDRRAGIECSAAPAPHTLESASMPLRNA
jgi:hypothetical protein